jgi:hypothetical protein
VLFILFLSDDDNKKEDPISDKDAMEKKRKRARQRRSLRTAPALAPTKNIVYENASDQLVDPSMSKYTQYKGNSIFGSGSVK